MTLADIQTSIDPKRDQTKSLFVSKVFDNRENSQERGVAPAAFSLTAQGTNRA